MDGDGELHLQMGGEAVFIEDHIDGGTKGFEADCTVLPVVLDVGELCLSAEGCVGDGVAVEDGVDDEPIGVPGGDTEYEYLCRIPGTGGKLYMPVELAGESYGVVRAISYDIVAVVSERPPPKKKAFQHNTVKLGLLFHCGIISFDFRRVVISRAE